MSDDNKEFVKIADKKCCGSCRYFSHKLCTWLTEAMAGKDLPDWFYPDNEQVDSFEGTTCDTWRSADLD